MSTELCSKDGILIGIMQVSDYPKVKIFMGNNFYKGGEPLCSSSGEDVQKINEKENDEYHISMIEQGTCILATEEKSGRIVGSVLAGAQVPSDLEKHRKDAAVIEPHTWGRMMIFVSKVETEIDLFKRYGISKLLYSHMTTVDATMRGKGLGTRLAAALMEVGRSKGFPLMIAYCSSFYSARQKEALGMECVYQQAYADYKDDSGNVVFKPPAPHTHLRVMAIKL